MKRSTESSYPQPEAETRRDELLRTMLEMLPHSPSVSASPVTVNKAQTED
jgi:hypothetical protein